jgi:hypothetical protein
MVQAVVVALFTAQVQDNQERLYGFVAEVDRVMTHAERIAHGDLTGTIDGDSEVSGTIRKMLAGLRASPPT